MERGWLGLPYHTISEHYNNLFNEKVYKVPVAVVDDCPNRRGLKGMQTCVFCDVWGSAANAESLSMELRQQIETYQKRIAARYNAKAFLIYFQAYTNTFTKVSSLRANFDIALSYPWVKGFTIGTRPDCLSKAVLDLWQEYHQKSFVSVELGVQSFFDDQLEFMRRGHSSKDSIEAIKKITEMTEVDLGIHLIFGSPGETDDHIIKTAEIVNELPISNIKLHNLHVLKNTPLEAMYQSHIFNPIDRETYAHRVELFLQHISPRFYLHRLAAYSSRWDELIAPDWTKDKMGTHQYIIDYLRARGSYQSQKYVARSDKEVKAQAVLAKRALPIPRDFA